MSVPSSPPTPRHSVQQCEVAGSSYSATTFPFRCWHTPHSSLWHSGCPGMDTLADHLQFLPAHIVCQACKRLLSLDLLAFQSQTKVQKHLAKKHCLQEMSNNTIQKIKIINKEAMQIPSCFGLPLPCNMEKRTPSMQKHNCQAFLLQSHSASKPPSSPNPG